MATAQTICLFALKLIGAYGIADTPASTSASADLALAFEALNNMVRGWRTQPLTVIAIEREVFNLTANQATYTIGAGGDFDIARPLMVNGAGLLLNGLTAAQSVTSITRVSGTATVTQTSHPFVTGDVAYLAGATQSQYNGLQTVTKTGTNTYTYPVSGSPATPATGTITAQALNGTPVEIPRSVLTDDAYQAIQIKTLTSSLFTAVYYNPTQPLGSIFLWPTPTTAANQLVLYLANVFDGFDDLTTDYTFADLPGYIDALEYGLAKRLWPFFAHTDEAPLVEIKEMARTTLGTVKRANYKLSDLPNEAAWAIGGSRSFGYNINTGTGG